MTHFPALIVVGPLLTAFLVAAAYWMRPRLCYPLTLFGVGVSLVSALGMLIQVVDSGPIEYRMAGWPPPMGIVYYVDHLSGLVAAIVAAVAMVNLTGVYQGVKQEMHGKEGAFYSLYLLSLTGLLGIVVTGDAFNLYVLVEIASLTGYALVGMGSPRAALSGFNYVIVGTVGACLYLLGVGYLYIMTGSLNMADIARLLPPLYDSPAILVAFVMALVGLWVKMAFFPLHVWLPNAYSYAPSPSASLMAPLMTKVMIYVMIRLVFTIFTWDYLLNSGVLADLVVWLSVLAIVAGGIYALAERNLKRMLTYLIVAEVGYMVGGAFLGTKAGLTGAILHIVNDAAMTLCLFMAAGSLFYKTRSMEFDALKGVLKEQPWSMAALIVGGLAVIGVPPTCGFFSKWYLVLGGLQAGHYGYVAALILSSLISIVLFFRVIEIGYFEPFDTGHGHEDSHGHHDEAHASTMDEAPVSMLVPLIFSAAGLFALGLGTNWLVTRVIEPFIPKGLM